MTINLRLSEVGDTVDEIGKEFLGDHVGAQGLTLPTGQSYVQYLVAFASNDGDEPDGQVTMQLLESDEYRIHPEHSAATFIVIDNDPTPVLTVTGATVAEGGGSIDFQVALSSTVSPPSLQTVTVEYETRDGAAVAGEDYTAVRAALTLAPEATGGVISVPVLDDGWAEYREASAWSSAIPPTRCCRTARPPSLSPARSRTMRRAYPYRRPPRSRRGSR